MREMAPVAPIIARLAAQTGRTRAYKDAAAMVRRWSQQSGLTDRFKTDMDMLARQIEARAEQEEA
jgi:hypothetical protein